MRPTCPYYLFELCVGRERKMRTYRAEKVLISQGKSLDTHHDMESDAENNIGSNPSNRFQHDSTGNKNIRSNCESIYAKVQKLVILSRGSWTSLCKPVSSSLHTNRSGAFTLVENYPDWSCYRSCRTYQINVWKGCKGST